MTDSDHNPLFDDKTAFQIAVQDVEPLRPTGRYLHQHPLPPPVPLPKIAMDSRLASGWNDQFTFEHITSFLAEGQPKSLLQNLKRGRFRPCSELDLHGFNRHEAREQLHIFLEEAKSYREHCICVIPGKGLRSADGEPVLRILVKGWLAQSEHVIAFCEAPISSGGSGAIFVLLKTDSPDILQKYT